MFGETNIHGCQFGASVQVPPCFLCSAGSRHQTTCPGRKTYTDLECTGFYSIFNLFCLLYKLIMLRPLDIVVMIKLSLENSERVPLCGMGFRMPGPEVLLEPLARESCHFFEGPWFLEEVRCPWNDFQLFLGIEPGQGVAIQI